MNLRQLADPLPDPWMPWFLPTVAVSSSVSTTVSCLRAGSVNSVSGLLVFASCLLLAAAYRRLIVARPMSPDSSATGAEHSRAYLMVLAAVLLSVGALALASVAWLGWLAVLLPSGLVVVLGSVPRRNRWMDTILGSLLLASPSLMMAVALGQPGRGGFPFALLFLFSLVVLATREVEHRVAVLGARTDDATVHALVHRSLAWVSVVFFFFGVVCLWPWLGGTYGGVYFWMLIVGVFAPILLFWGALRQPQRGPLAVALRRFNRVMPYVGVILLAAFAIG
jgi:hypothetical protein